LNFYLSSSTVTFHRKLTAFIAGIVVAVYGHENEKGIFVVKDYCFKDLTIPKALPPTKGDK
jgi:hypothetical protein